MKDPERFELVTYRLKKEEDTLKEIDILLENELWHTAVNRLYYACYYAVSALLVNNSITARTHAGVRQMFGLHFIKPDKIDIELGKYYSDIFDKRQIGDYEDYIEFEKEEVYELLPPARKLIKAINQIIRSKE